jgi:Na+-translocating ferredoxin:NAD+ oxidoreductase RnfC subunit
MTRNKLRSLLAQCGVAGVTGQKTGSPDRLQLQTNSVKRLSTLIYLRHQAAAREPNQAILLS